MIEIKYSNLTDRNIKAKEQEAKGLRMVHDNFDLGWEVGTEPHGTMIFTDEPEPVVKATVSRDLLKEIDELKARIEELEK